MVECSPQVCKAPGSTNKALYDQVNEQKQKAPSWACICYFAPGTILILDLASRQKDIVVGKGTRENL